MSSPNQLVECVVNVSEGRDLDVLDTIKRAIGSVPGCVLLHRDVGASAHRTVFTFAGEPEGVFEAAYRVYKVCAERIDMQKHRGEHPRIGAVDVCPFIPVKNVPMRDIVARTRVLGERVGAELGIPVYLYEESAAAPHRRNLADMRRGEYEGLRVKTGSAEWQPDFGPSYNAQTGATVLGARPFLIAWNINLSPEVTLATAKLLAAQLRGSGSKGQPGLFPGLKAIGWYLEEFGRCQVSCNIAEPDRMDMARVFLTAVNLAESYNARVTGSELIGLIPEKYLRKAGKAFCLDGSRKGEIDAAVAVLGLDELLPFNSEDRVLEVLLARKLSAP